MTQRAFAKIAEGMSEAIDVAAGGSAPPVEPIGEEAVRIRQLFGELETDSIGQLPWTEVATVADEAVRAIADLEARLRAAEANQRILIAALRGSLQAQDRNPGDEAFDAAVAQMLEPGQPLPPPPEPRT